MLENSFVHINQPKTTVNNFTFSSPTTGVNDLPPPPSIDRDIQPNLVRQPRRPVSSSFDSINSSNDDDDDDSNGPPTKSYLNKNGHGDNFDGPVSSDLFAIESTETPARSGSPIEILDDDKWNQISPPISPSIRKIASMPNHEVSFMPELLDDEPLDSDMSAFIPERNAFGEVIGGKNTISPRFSPSSFKSKQLSPVDSQKAFDASFDALAFPTQPLDKEILSEPESIDMNFSPSGKFSGKDPFFPGYDVLSAEKRQNVQKNFVSTPTVDAASKFTDKSSSQTFFPDVPLDELDQIAMSPFGLKSASMEAHIGSSFKGNNFRASVPQDETSSNSIAQNVMLNSSTSNSRDRTNNARVNYGKNPPSSSSPRSPSSHSPSVVLRRIQQRRAQERQEKAGKNSSTANDQACKLFQESPTDEQSSNSFSRSAISTIESLRANEEVILNRENSPTLHIAPILTTTRQSNIQQEIASPQRSISPTSLPINQELIGEFDSKVKVDDKIRQSSPKSNEIDINDQKQESSSRSNSSTLFKVTHPNRLNKPIADKKLSPKAKDKDSRSLEATTSNGSFSSIQDEIRRLDAMAMNSQSQSNLPKPLRRSVKQPVTYKEPSVSSKLRQGDVFFPKQEEGENEQSNIPNQGPKNAGEVLQDLADSTI